jgi:hypothetical protein
MRRALAAAVALALAACGGDAREAEQAVRRYDDASIAAYRAGTVEPLEALATARERKKVQVLVDLKKANGLVLESELRALDVERSERLGADLVKVRTRESWRYRDRPVAPGVPGGPSVSAEMTMEYSVVRDGGRWKVDDVRTLASRALEEPRAAGQDAGR